MKTTKIPSESKLQDTYTKTYRMQIAGLGETIRTSVPKEVVEKEAKRHGLKVEEFVKKFRVSWLYNGFDGAWARFVPREENVSQKPC